MDIDRAATCDVTLRFLGNNNRRYAIRAYNDGLSKTPGGVPKNGLSVMTRVELGSYSESSLISLPGR